MTDSVLPKVSVSVKCNGQCGVRKSYDYTGRQRHQFEPDPGCLLHSKWADHGQVSTLVSDDPAGHVVWVVVGTTRNLTMPVAWAMTPADADRVIAGLSRRNPGTVYNRLPVSDCPTLSAPSEADKCDGSCGTSQCARRVRQELAEVERVYREAGIVGPEEEVQSRFGSVAARIQVLREQPATVQSCQDLNCTDCFGAPTGHWVGTPGG